MNKEPHPQTIIIAPQRHRSDGIYEDDSARIQAAINGRKYKGRIPSLPEGTYIVRPDGSYEEVKE